MATLWVLGAEDPEMLLVEKVLLEAAELVTYAALDGQRVRQEEAYASEAKPSDPVGPKDLVVAVECGVAEASLRIDHHRPGDPWFGQPAKNFLVGSSLGQVLWHLFQKGKIGLGKTFPPGVFVLGVDGAWYWSQADRPDIWAWLKQKEGPQVWWPAEHSRPEQPKPQAGVWTAPSVFRVSPDEVDSGLRTGSSYRLRPEWVVAAATDHCLMEAYRGECPGVDPEAVRKFRLGE